MKTNLAYHNYERNAERLKLLDAEDQRVFCAVGGITYDDRENAVDAEIVYLDRTLDGAKWHKWNINHILHFNPFKFKLETTKRAGLHIVMEFCNQKNEMQYINNMKISETGIFILNPSNTIWPSQKYNLVALGSREEFIVSSLMKNVYELGFGLPAIREAEGLPIPAHEYLKDFVHAA